MKMDQLEEILAEYKGSAGSYPFGPEAHVFKVKGKMFALVSQGEDPRRLTVKCDPVDAGNLVQQYESVSPGYYMNKKHWITIRLDGELPEDLILSLVEESYLLVVAKLPKKDRVELA